MFDGQKKFFNQRFFFFFCLARDFQGCHEADKDLYVNIITSGATFVRTHISKVFLDFALVVEPTISPHPLLSDLIMNQTKIACRKDIFRRASSKAYF